jgi:hypothetical protein
MAEKKAKKENEYRKKMRNDNKEGRMKEKHKRK